MPKVTIAIPTYNREKYLKVCLQSILRQSFADFEVVICDNCSDYDVCGLVDGLGDDRFKVIVHKKNIGALGNFDFIFRYPWATPYLIVFHDDDAMHPDLLTRSVALLDAQPNLAFVVSSLATICRDDLMLSFDQRVVPISPRLGDRAALVRLIMKQADYCFNSVVYRVKILAGGKSILGYNDIFAKWCDRPFFLDLAKNQQAAFIPDRLVNYRFHTEQDSQLDHSDKFSYFLNLYHYYRNCLPQPLNTQDFRLFYSWTTNSLLLATSWFAKTPAVYFHLLTECYKQGLFKIGYVNIRGLYYGLQVIKKMLRQNFF